MNLGYNVIELSQPILEIILTKGTRWIYRVSEVTIAGRFPLVQPQVLAGPLLAF
jgi:hypothetical protein